MLSQCKEEDFYQIKSVAQNRMSPKNTIGFSWAVLFFSVLMTVLSVSGLEPDDSKVSTLMVLMLLINLFLIIIQFLFTVLFTSKIIAFKFQKLQSVFLSFIGFKFSLDTYQFFLGVSERFSSPRWLNNIGYLLLLSGIVFLIIFTFRAFKRVKGGELRKGGKGLYNFQKSKGSVSVPFIFGLTMLGGAAGRYFSEMSSDITVIVSLFFAVVIQYSLALALPEIFLLMYCKFRFKSFKVEMPK